MTPTGCPRKRGLHRFYTRVKFSKTSMPHNQSAYQAKWDEICFLLSVPANMTEEDFLHRNVLRAIERLGWDQVTGEIVIKPRIQIGTQGTIQPDIVLYSPEHGPLIAIEVKRPQEPIDAQGFSRQLFSCQRLHNRVSTANQKGKEVLPCRALL